MNISATLKLASLFELKIKQAQLSETEEAQLGSEREGSAYPYVKREDWSTFREFLVDRSRKSNPQLDPELTAYTPGETVNLLKHPKIVEWMQKMRDFKIPDQYKIIVLVPCAKTKPWGSARPKKSDLYNSYHKILEMNKQGELPIGEIYFVTISEPLGVVPQDLWDTFPQYDNPGLFSDPVMRSGGLFTKDYPKTPIKSKHIIPFDEAAYQSAIATLAGSIEQFMQNNAAPGRVFVSFVEDPSGKIKTTHSDMLDKANIENVLPSANRFAKPSGKTSRTEGKATPLQHYLRHLQQFAK